MEHVDTGVDPVSDEFDWLFDESVNDGRSWLGDDHTIVGWLGDLCHLRQHQYWGRESVMPKEGRVGRLTMMDPSHPWDKWKSLSGQLRTCEANGVAYRKSSNG